MKRITDYLRRVNTWAVIAILAMTGWLLDSLFWFLETHSLTTAGLVTYLSHSWYAFPLVGAIFIMLRLRQPSELLALTIYDERGAPIHHQGDFRLEEAVRGPIFASFHGSSQKQRLHCLELPAGPTVYFLHQGGLTLLAAFSGTVRPAQLEGGLRLMRQAKVPTENLLRDLPFDVAALAVSLLAAPVERDVLTHLWDHRQMAMTATDLAGRLGREADEIVAALDNLERLALVQHQCACDMTFYRLTEDESWLARLDQFITWRGDWLGRARRVERLIGSTNLNPNTADRL